MRRYFTKSVRRSLIRDSITTYRSLRRREAEAAELRDFWQQMSTTRIPPSRSPDVKHGDKGAH